MEENTTLTKAEEKANQKSLSDISLHKDVALQKLNALLTNYLNNPATQLKADKLSYWLEDYCSLLSFEESFKPNYLKSYSRGDVIKVNLGYNIGNEEGGLHYCVVIDKKNSIHSGIITVLPLTSDKGQRLHFSEVNIGNDVYSSFQNKLDNIMLELSHKINSFKPDKVSHEEIFSALTQLELTQKINSEICKMKLGSIALVSQITTISKQRIYDPQHTGDLLSGVHISDASLDLINNKMKQLFIVTTQP